GAACSRQLPDRRAEVAAGAAAPGLAHKPEFAAAGGGIGAAMGLNDPADPGGDSDAVEISGPLPAAPIEMAHSGSAHDEPCAPQKAAGEQELRTRRGDLAAAAGRPPQAGGESQDEPLVSGEDDEDRPAAVRGAAAV